MSSDPTPRGAAPAYDEAEKGTLDQVAVYPVEKKPITYPADEKKDVFNEKKDLAVLPAPQVKKDPYMAQKGAKKEVSKVILFKLWYNTYRYVAGILRASDCAHHRC